MEIFVSWSGERSRQLAQALRQWIPDVLQYTRPWVSGEISSGKRWSQEVAERMRKTNYGILCLTPENVGAPWIMFEAGGLAKDWHAARVVPLLFGGLRPGDLLGPLDQFQAKQASRLGLAELVQDINLWSGERTLEPEVIGRQFDRCWPEFWPAIEKIASDRPEDHFGRSPSNGTAVDGSIIDKLISDLIQTVTRAIILPRSPEEAKVGSTVFSLRGDRLFCTHHWSPNQAERVVDRLSFVISPEVAKEVMVVKSVLNERIERGSVRPLQSDERGVSGEVPQTLTYVISAPIFDVGGKVQGAWGFDTSSEVGEIVLKDEMSETVMHQVGEHIANLLSLACSSCLPSPQ